MRQNDAWKREFIWQIYQTIESGYCEKKIELSSGQFRNCCRNWPRRRLPKTKQRESRWRQKEKFADLKRYSIVIATLALGHTSNQKAAQKECSPQRFLSLSLSVDAQNDSRNERLPDWESQFEIATNRRPSISLLKFLENSIWKFQFVDDVLKILSSRPYWLLTSGYQLYSANYSLQLAANRSKRNSLKWVPSRCKKPSDRACRIAISFKTCLAIHWECRHPRLELLVLPA